MAHMSFEEETEFRSWIRDGLDRIAPLDRTRILVEEGRRADAVLWSELAELGVLGLLVDEEHGGAGAGPTALALFLAEAGRVLLPVGHLAGTTVIPWILRSDKALAAEILPQVSTGEVRAAFADHSEVSVDATGDVVSLSGVIDQVPDADVSDLLFVVAPGDDAFVVETQHADVQRLASLDETRAVSTVRLDQVRARRVGTTPDSIEQARLLLCLARAAEATGAASRLLDMSVEYAKVREQFGRPIGQFQAIKHRSADMFVAVQASTAMVLNAFGRLEDSGRIDSVSAEATALYVNDAFMAVAASAMQIHGGVAFSWEHEAHLYLKRAKANQILAGGSERGAAALADSLFSSERSILSLVGLEPADSSV